MGRRGKPRAIGRKGAQRRVRPLHQFRRSPKGIYFNLDYSWLIGQKVCVKTLITLDIY